MVVLILSIFTQNIWRQEEASYFDVLMITEWTFWKKIAV